MNHILSQAKVWIAGHRKESAGILAGILILAVGIGMGIFSLSGTSGVSSSGRTTGETKERKWSEDVNTAEKQGAAGKQVTISSGIKKESNGNTSTVNTFSSSSSNANRTSAAKDLSVSGNAVSGNSSLNTSNNNTQPSGGSSNSGSENSGNSNSNTGNENTQTHKHEYNIPITVDHPEESHYEDKIVKDSWTEEVKELHVVCFTCSGNKIIDDQAAQHVMWHAERGETCRYGDKEVVVDTIEHLPVTEPVKIVDKEAWTEIIGYKCTCGDEKMQ